MGNLFNEYNEVRILIFYKANLMTKDQNQI